jgi:hypothetical protein
VALGHQKYQSHADNVQNKAPMERDEHSRAQIANRDTFQKRNIEKEMVHLLVGGKSWINQDVYKSHEE